MKDKTIHKFLEENHIFTFKLANFLTVDKSAPMYACFCAGKYVDGEESYFRDLVRCRNLVCQKGSGWNWAKELLKKTASLSLYTIKKFRELEIKDLETLIENYEWR